MPAQSHWSGFVLLLLFGSLACSTATEKTPADANTPRRSHDADLALHISQAPDPWEFLPHGTTLVAGTIQTTYGLDPAQPMTVRVLDITSRHLSEVKLFPDSVVAPHTMIPLNGGPFVVDLTQDYRLSEGLKLVELRIHDTQGQFAAYKFGVNSGPLFEVTEADIAQARRGYGLRFLPVFAQYRRWAEELTEGGDLAPNLAQHLDYDLAVLRQLEETFTDALLIHPDTGEWDRIATTMTDQLEQFRLLGGQLSPAEAMYRDQVEAGASMWADNLRMAYDSAVEMQWYFGSAVPPPTPDELRWTLAFYRHVFPVVERHQTDTTQSYTLNIHTDQGLVPLAHFGQQPYAPPLEGTWQQESPVFTLDIFLSDSDEDGIFETLQISGQVQGTPLEQLVGESPIQHHGHLLTGLTCLQLSPYFDPALF
ncbi:MAG: hypothetical protein GEEBNDBF_02076 [bacterium]|nr:hypothetical protein [bacterium]